MKISKNIIKPLARFILAGALVMLVVAPMTTPKQAAAATEMSARLTNATSSQSTGVTIRAVLGAAISAGDTITIDFNSFTNGTTIDAGDITSITAAATCTGVTTTTYSPTSTPAPTALDEIYVFGPSATTVSFATSTSFTSVGVNDCLRIVLSDTAPHTLTTPSASGSYSVTLAKGLASVSTLVNILNPSTVTVTASVDQSLSCSIGTTAVSFGTLSGPVRWATAGTGTTSEPAAPVTLSSATNATNGLQWSALTSLLTNTNGDTIPDAAQTGAATTASASTESYGFYVDNAAPLTLSGWTIDTDYDDDGTPASPAGAINSGAQDTFASITAPINTTSIDLEYVAASTATTEPGTYTSTQDLVCTALF